MNLYIIQNGNTYDVTKAASGLTWRYELETLAAELSFGVTGGGFAVGSVVIMKEKNREIFRGVIVTESGKDTVEYTCMDLGWYLNKNEVIVQFKKSTIYDAVLHLTKKFNIPTELPTSLKKATITKLYKDVGVGDILKELLETATAKTNTRYYMRMYGGVLAIRTYQREPISIYGVGVDYTLGRSIENMSNKVVIVSSEEKSSKVYAEVKDDASIKKYGLLQTIETVDAEDVSKARNIAKNKLKELNRITEDISVSCIGNYDIVAGRRVTIDNEELKGDFVVKEVTHTYTNDRNYFCELTLERWETFVLGYTVS